MSIALSAPISAFGTVGSLDLFPQPAAGDDAAQDLFVAQTYGFERPDLDANLAFASMPLRAERFAAEAAVTPADLAETRIASTAIEREVDAGWNAGGPLAALKGSVDALVTRVVADHALVIVAPHHAGRIPADADTVSAAAAIWKRLAHEAHAQGRTLRVIDDPTEARDDGALSLCLLPISDDMKGYTDEDRARLDLPHLQGMRALFVGDIRFNAVDDFQRSGDFGFDAIVVQDHHQWDDAFVQTIDARASDDLILINNHHVLGRSDASLYCSGAFCADLYSTGDPVFAFIKRLALVGDKFHTHFPRTMAGFDVAAAEPVADTLNLVGPYLGGKSAVAARSCLREIVQGLAASESIAAFEEKLDAIMAVHFGDHFRSWSGDIAREVHRSIDLFKRSDDPVFFHRIDSTDAITILVSKLVYAQLADNGGYGDRVLVHYRELDGGHVDAMLARDPHNDAIDLTRLCLSSPGGERWGGGYPNRGGFNTASAKEDVEQWWGSERDSAQRVGIIFDYVRRVVSGRGI